MSIDFEFCTALAIWLTAIPALFLQGWRGHPVAGLTLAWIFNLAIIHLFGALIQLLPWYTSPDVSYTVSGFKVTGYALLGIAAGHVISYAMGFRPLRTVPVVRQDSRSLGRRQIIVGGIGYFVLLPILANVPTVSAIVSSSLFLVCTGLCVSWWSNFRDAGGEREGQVKRTAPAASARSGVHGGATRVGQWRVFAMASVLPFLGVSLSGFLGYSATALVAMMSFVAMHHRPRRTVVIGAVLIVFFGISLFPTYFNSRKELRAATWGDAGLAERFSKTWEVLVANFSFFDYEEQSHLDSIEQRMNQNVLVGQAVMYMAESRAPFANGETLLNAVIAVVPRILWPGKPSYAGSAGLVSQYTGRTFAAGTSVGVGPVLELYINFGVPGVFFGFAGLGLALRRLDLAAAHSLKCGDVEAFANLFMLGLPMLSSQGNFAEISAAMIGAFILQSFVARLTASEQARRDRDRKIYS